MGEVEDEARRAAADRVIAHCRELAEAALRAVEADDGKRVGRCIDKAIVRYGAAGIEALLVHWADIAIAADMPSWDYYRSRPRPVALEIHDATVSDGSTAMATDIDNETPAVRWTGRFIAARASHDEPTAMALLQQLWALLRAADPANEIGEIMTTTLNAAHLAGRPWRT